MLHGNPVFSGHQLRENGLWLSDNEIGNATTARHGFLKKLPGGTSTFLRGDGTFAAPTGGGSSYMYAFSDAIDDPINDNFREGDGAGGMDTAGTRSNPSTASAWTAENIGASTVVVSNGRLWLTSPASASIQIRGYYQPVPSGNWCVRMAVMIRPTAANTTEKAVGMYLRDSTSGKLEWWGIGYSGGVAVLWANKMTNATTHSAVRSAVSISGQFFPTFLEIENDGTNYYLRYGVADAPPQLLVSFARTNFLTVAADGIGVFSENDVSVAATLITRGFYRVPESSVLA